MESSFGSVIRIRLAEYASEVLHAHICYENTSPIHPLLHNYVCEAGYSSDRGEKRKRSQLLNDLREYYQGMPECGITEKVNLETVLSGQRWHFSQICELAVFLNIPLKDLCKPTFSEQPSWEVLDRKILELHQKGFRNYEIAHKLGVSAPTVQVSLRKIARVKAGIEVPVRKKTSYGRDWNQIDKQCLPKVKIILAELEGDSETPPQRVNFRQVALRLGIAETTMKSLPMCYQLVEKHICPVEEYWSRKIAWAIRDIRKRGDCLCFNQIYKRAGIQRRNLSRCETYISEILTEEEYAFFRTLLGKPEE